MNCKAGELYLSKAIKSFFKMKYFTVSKKSSAFHEIRLFPTDKQCSTMKWYDFEGVQGREESKG